MNQACIFHSRDSYGVNHDAYFTSVIHTARIKRKRLSPAIHPRIHQAYTLLTCRSHDMSQTYAFPTHDPCGMDQAHIFPDHHCHIVNQTYFLPVHVRGESK